MNTKLMQLREELKMLAVDIRESKLENRETQRSGGRGYFEYRNLSHIYRHKHIAYSLLLGRTMKQIENKNREHNEPNASEIKKYMEMYSEEIICVA